MAPNAGSFVAVAPPQDMAAEASLRDWHIAMPSDMELRSLGPFMQQAPGAPCALAVIVCGRLLIALHELCASAVC